MNVSVITADQLTADHVAAWSRLQRADPSLESPFFRPEFTQALAAVRSGTEVAVIEQDGEPRGFFPFERVRQGIAQSPGTPFTDYHGVVVDRNLRWTAEELLRRSGLKAWSFDHLVASQQHLQSYHYMLTESPYMDLVGGFDSYAAALRRRGSREIPQLLRKSRKIQREVGPIRFEKRTRDRRAFETLIRWKRQQCRETGVTDPFELPWGEALLEKILATDTEAFSGLLSTLYIGDRLAAVNFGLRSHGILHGLVQAYDREFRRYSPGVILTLRIAQAAESLGIDRIDFGKGPEEYKRRLRSGATPLAVGAVDLRPIAASARLALFRTRQWVLGSRIYRPARATARAGARVFPPLKGWLALRRT